MSILEAKEVNKERAGLPHFMMVDTPGLGCADIERAAAITRDWPDLIYDYLRNREALKHVFHLAPWLSPYCFFFTHCYQYIVIQLLSCT